MPGGFNPRMLPFYDANNLVLSGWDYFQGLSSDLLSAALNSAANVAAVNIEPLQFDATFEGDFAPGVFVPPASPGAPPSFGAITTQVPNFPGTSSVSVAGIGSAPAAPDFSSYMYVEPGDPGSGPADPAVVIPTLAEIELPPELELPDIDAIPELYLLTMPDTPPDVSIAPFDASGRPVIDFEVPTKGFQYTEQSYVASLALEIKTKMSQMLVGGTGLPVAVEQALFDRSRDREDKLALRALQETVDEFVTRGFVEPNGLLSRRLDEVRKENRDKLTTLNRELTIQRHKEEIEAIRFAVAQGLACEQLLIEQVNQQNNRALQAAQATVDWAFKVYEGRIGLFNAQLEAFKTDAQVYIEMIRAKQLEVEVYKALVEAEEVKGRVNEALIRAYTESIRARDQMVQTYRTQVEAARVKAEIQNLRLERTRTEIGLFEGMVRAYGERVNAYRATVEGRLGNVRAMESVASAYSSRVQAFRTSADVVLEQARVEVAQNEHIVNAFRAAVEGASTRIRAEAENAAISASNYRARADIYAAEGQIASAEAESLNRAASIRIEAERARVDAALKSADIRINQAIKIAEILVESLRGRSQTYAQLAASVLNGVNLGASISGDSSLSSSESFNYSGEI